MKSSIEAGDILLDHAGAVTKILVVDEAASIFHIRLYRGAHASAESVLAALEADALEWSIGHAPVDAPSFGKAQYTRVTNEAVREDELEGYRLYVGGMKQAAASSGDGFLAKFWRIFGGNA